MPPPTSVTLDLSEFVIRRNLPQTTTMYTPNVSWHFWVKVSVSGLSHGIRQVPTGGPLTSTRRDMFDEKEQTTHPLGYQILIPVEPDDTGIAATVFMMAAAGGQYSTAPDTFFRVSMHYDSPGEKWKIDRPAIASASGLVATSDNIALIDDRRGEATVYGEYRWQNEKPYFEGTIKFAI